MSPAKQQNPLLGHPPIVAVAPMMAWTDKHCRYLLRLYSPSALLFTEMVTTGALLQGQKWRQLDYNVEEQPLALQLGGNHPQDLADCALAAQDRGYTEINLNVGCPSSRVQNGAFGACLMRQPELVAECVAHMGNAVQVPVTVKCRLGVDEHDSDELLSSFVQQLQQAGCKRLYLHARKAILGGLSPAQNRSIPPLQPERVQRIKQQFPELQIIINGGITQLDQVNTYLAWADGVMIGRAAYHNPDFLSEIHDTLFATPATRALDKDRILAAYTDYVAAQLAAGERLGNLTRHLLHSANGIPGARKFRQTLSDSKRLQQGDIQLLQEAFEHLALRPALQPTG